MNETDNQRVVEQIYAAFGRADLAAILDSLGENVEWRLPRGGDIPWGGNRRGKNEVAQFFMAIAATVDPLQFGPREFITRGNKVIVLGSETMRIKATQRTYTTEWVHEWRLEGGKVAAFQEYMDTASIIDALGGEPKW